MTIAELAAYVCSHFEKNNIKLVLTGGACVTIYSKNPYQSKDLDFIEYSAISTTKKLLSKIFAQIDFHYTANCYIHKDVKPYIELVKGPLAVGNEPVSEISKMILSTGILYLLSPTDCIKDRLAAYYYWKDAESLYQAIYVAQSQKINIEEIKRWSRQEGELKKFKDFENMLLILPRLG